MQRSQRNAALVLLAAMSGAPSAAMPSLRRSGAAPAAALLAHGQEPITADTDMKEVTTKIHEKWDKMGDFMEIMFMLACKAKHGQDVTGLASEKLKNEEISGDEVMEFRKQTQKKNMQSLSSACGSIVAKGESPCRQRCADGFGDAMQKRKDCDNKCVIAYTTFETNCRKKAANLEKIYEMKNDMANARKQCHEGHCSIFPTVWMKAEEEQQAAVDEGCEGRCTEDSIKLSCEKDFAINLDFAMGGIRQTCFDASEAPACYEEKSATVSTDQETCATEGAATCGEQHTECTAAGETDAAAPEAAAFCDERKTMCEEQVTADCLKKHEAGLDAADKECQEASKEALKTCEDEAVAAKETEDVEKCVTEEGPACTDNCNKDCDVAKMNECLGGLDTDNDETEMFCTDFWHLLHDSSETDPSTGNPIVLLAPKANITKANITKATITKANVTKANVTNSSA